MNYSTDENLGNEAFLAAAQDPTLQKLFGAALINLGKASAKGAQALHLALHRLLSDYSEYLIKTRDTVSTIKTFANPSEPVLLIDHFVSCTLQCNKSTYSENEIRENLGKNGRIIVTALAGFGKSILLKYLALSFYENPMGKIPIFIELRDLNRIQNPDLITYIHSTYKQVSNTNKSLFEEGMNSGIFSIFLDGFDELNIEHRKNITSQILDISNEYKGISIILSSRPDDTFSSWKDFSCYRIMPMALNQIVELIGKIDYDPKLKSNFVKKLKSGLYEEHKTFMSTPLLATLMMLTFEKNAKIPEKMHLFYLRAFETLFDKHDTYKEQYERKRKCNLEIDEFSRIFSAFCYISYLQEKFEFDRISILNIIDEAISYCGHNANSHDFLHDVTESVCLIQIEANTYSFVHRSFQEYFTSVFLSNCPSEDRCEFLNDPSARSWDNVLPMLLDIARDRVEVEWVLPTADAYLQNFEQKSVAASRIATHLHTAEIEYRHSHSEFAVSYIKAGEYSGFIANMKSLYKKEFLKIYPKDKDEYLSEFSKIDEFFKESFGDNDKTYIPFLDVIKKGIKLKEELPQKKKVSLHPSQKYSINSPYVKDRYEEYNIIRGIRNSVSDSKGIKKNLLDRFRQRRNRP